MTVVLVVEIVLLEVIAVLLEQALVLDVTVQLLASVVLVTIVLLDSELLVMIALQELIVAVAALVQRDPATLSLLFAKTTVVAVSPSKEEALLLSKPHQ